MRIPLVPTVRRGARAWRRVAAAGLACVAAACSSNVDAQDAPAQTSAPTAAPAPAPKETPVSHSDESTDAPAETHAAPALPSDEEIAQLPSDGGDEFNRLIFETSPYLRQHARNPVDWYPWGEDAFDRARAENRPIFLSVGYSSCHWCHVMAHESFEDPETAQLMNEFFINIKVDREERPDVDDIYMKAVQLITGRGGWPMSVWLLPDGRPYYGGTYFPREDSGRGVGFKSILVALARTYRERHDEVEQQATKLADTIREQLGGAQVQPMGPLGRDVADRAIAELLNTFDGRHGGFGQAPKFPPHMSLDLLLYEYERTGREDLAAPIRVTLDAMLLGGVHDHVGGGFHRYSTDAIWLVPHFEKMLYDNGQLLRAYTEAARLFGEARYRRTAEGIATWALRDMRAPEGPFYSAYDADSEGEEGKYYVWTRDEVLQILGETEGELFCRVYNIEKGGNWHEESTGQSLETNIPHLTQPLDALAVDLKLKPEELAERMVAARETLRKVRAKRIWPGLDDKLLTSWNGLMIAGLADAGKTFDTPEYLRAAEEAADFILTTMRKDGRLFRSYNHGQAKANAYLDDYAFLAFGLLELHDATGNERWLTEARALIDTLFTHHWDEAGGGFYFTSDDHEDLLARKKDSIDGAIPSGNGVAARVLVRLATLTGDERYAKAAQDTFDTSLGWMHRAPRAVESLILAVAEAYDGGLYDTPEPAAVAAADTPKTDGPDATWQTSQVMANAYASHLTLHPGAQFTVAVQLSIADGWHVNSNAPLQDYLIPTALTLADGEVLTAGAGRYPAGEEITLGFSPEPLSVYAGEVTLVLPVTVNAHAPPGSAAVELRLRVQACDDRQCLRPETATLTIPVTVAAAPAREDPRHPEIFNRR